MNSHLKRISVIGRANTALIYGYGKNSKGVISTVIAKVCEQNASDRISITGPISFDEKAVKHINEMILPIMRNILKELKLPERSFELSVVNLDVSAIMDVGIQITGFSAGTAIFSAVSSCALQIALPNDILFTGHIASKDGNLKTGNSFEDKINTAGESKRVRTLIHPIIDSDESLNVLAPSKKGLIEDALTRANKKVKLVAVGDIGDLFQQIYPEELVILASLKFGFFGNKVLNIEGNSGVEKVIRHLVYNNENRFRRVLERKLYSGQNRFARELLDVFADYFIERRIYPKEFGFKLFRLMQSIPTATRQFKLHFPILSISKCIQLSQFSKESDHHDIPKLFMASSGEKSGSTILHVKRLASNEKGSTSQADGVLKFILGEINNNAMTRKICVPIELGQSQYRIGSMAIRDYEEFLDTVVSYYICIMRYTEKAIDPIDFEMAGRDALHLLEEAFANKGGHMTAFINARDGTNGGIKYVLDLMANQLKEKEIEKHIQAVIKLSVDPLNYDEKLQLIASLLKRIGNLLPREIASLPPERLVTHFEVLVRQYIKATDDLKSIFQSL
jgi:hypothetical protein